MSQGDEREPEEPPQKIAFDYIKSREFRVVRVDGIVGGPSTRGEIMMSFWNERPPIPQRVVHHFSDEGTLGDEIPEERISRDAIIREVEFCTLLNIKTAKAMQRWLEKHIALLDSLTENESNEVDDDGD